jgi:SAM-dependent methyltransferase
MGEPLPLPPLELAERVGQSTGSGMEPHDAYELIGGHLRGIIERSLPDDWTWADRRVLDFGSGAGRVLRQFAAEARVARFEGCDIDAPSIAWLNERLRPPFEGFVNAPSPPLDRPDDTYDLVYAMSVFTHITDEWSAWLLELRRVLKPDGILIASFLGEGMSEMIAREPWDERRVGMNVLHDHHSWDKGGPSVLLSPWWIREHWGRAFEIVELEDGTPNSHGYIVARPLPGAAPSRAELERVDPADTREHAALAHNIRQLHRAGAELEASVRAEYEQSRSWRLTAPLRRLAGARR